MKLSSRIERYLEWLEREQIPDTAMVTLQSLKEYLEDQLMKAGRKAFPFSEKQVQALYRAAHFETKTLVELGIRAVYQPRYLYHPVRYLIKGQPGLWGFAKVQKVLEAARR